MNSDEMKRNRFTEGMARIGPEFDAAGSSYYGALDLPRLGTSTSASEVRLRELYSTWLEKLPEQLRMVQAHRAFKDEDDQGFSGPLLLDGRSDGYLPGVTFESAMHTETIWAQINAVSDRTRLIFFREWIPQDRFQSPMSVSTFRSGMSYTNRASWKRVARTLSGWIGNPLFRAGIPAFTLLTGEIQGWTETSMRGAGILLLAYLALTIWQIMGKRNYDREVLRANGTWHDLFLALNRLGERWSKEDLAEGRK